MQVVFSMDGIKNMDQLYTWTTEYLFDSIPGKAEHYHGKDYCEKVIAALSGWKEKNYLGMQGRIANETFSLIAPDDTEYSIAFGINTYEEKLARLEVVIASPDIENYDQRLEKLKIELKDTLIPDWKKCTWIMDEQAAELCKEAYEQAFVVENNLRGFASKVLIHFLGVNWIRCFGLEKIATSVDNLKGKFVQRVPEFDNINTDFMSMTLETLFSVILKGVIYKEESITVGREDFLRIQQKAASQKSGDGIVDYFRGRLLVEKIIWDDLFAPFIDAPDAFKSALHDFVEDRNHVAHSKVLSWNSYQMMLRDFRNLESLINKANLKFDENETSSELFATWEAEQEELDDPEYEKEYIRDRISSETGMDILDESAIVDWFGEVLHNELYSDIYQHYHLDVCFEVSDYSAPSEDSILFSVSCPVEEDGSLRIDVIAESSIDDNLGGDSTCFLVARKEDGEDVCKAEIHFHNGYGSEGENGLMEADENTEYDTSELDDFKAELIAAIDELNPYPAKLDALEYEAKGSEQFVADIPCEQCGKFGISVNEALLPVGKCFYCGNENELEECVRCGALVGTLEHGMCPTCAAYVDEQ